jgi:hypothetical protein
VDKKAAAQSLASMKLVLETCASQPSWVAEITLGALQHHAIFRERLFFAMRRGMIFDDKLYHNPHVWEYVAALATGLEQVRKLLGAYSDPEKRGERARWLAEHNPRVALLATTEQIDVLKGVFPERCENGVLKLSEIINIYGTWRSTTPRELADQYSITDDMWEVIKWNKRETLDVMRRWYDSGVQRHVIEEAARLCNHLYDPDDWIKISHIKHPHQMDIYAWVKLLSYESLEIVWDTLFAAVKFATCNLAFIDAALRYVRIKKGIVFYKESKDESSALTYKRSRKQLCAYFPDLEDDVLKGKLTDTAPLSCTTSDWWLVPNTGHTAPRSLVDAAHKKHKSQLRTMLGITEDQELKRGKDDKRKFRHKWLYTDTNHLREPRDRFVYELLLVGRAIDDTLGDPRGVLSPFCAVHVGKHVYKAGWWSALHKAHEEWRVSDKATRSKDTPAARWLEGAPAEVRTDDPNPYVLYAVEGEPLPANIRTQVEKERPYITVTFSRERHAEALRAEETRWKYEVPLMTRGTDVYASSIEKVP